MEPKGKKVSLKSLEVMELEDGWMELEDVHFLP